LQARDLQDTPKLAIGDGALGFWAAINETRPATRQQRCWVHKTANVLAQLPDSSPRQSQSGTQEHLDGRDKGRCGKSLAGFQRDFAAKYPKAVNLLEKNREALLAFYDFPAEHWIHIRTTNPIESSFATIRHRTTRTKNCVSRNTLLVLVFQLALTAEKGWRRIRGLKQLPDVVNGIRFQDGIAVIREPEVAEEIQQIAPDSKLAHTRFDYFSYSNACGRYGIVEVNIADEFGMGGGTRSLKMRRIYHPSIRAWRAY